MSSAAEPTTATLTGILPVGTLADRGTVLFTADDEPTVALLGTVPAWRALQVGVDDGADVRQLEDNLVALGHGDGVTVDDTFTTATATAVERWETALGRSTPDGSVEIGDVAVLAEAGQVLDHEVEVGAILTGGATVLTIGSHRKILTATVAAADAPGWTPGTTVNLTWDDGATSTGTVGAIGTDVTDGAVALEVQPAEADTDRPTGAAVQITAVEVRRDGVVAVPVAGIVSDGHGGRAVRRPTAGGADELVPVRTGLVAGGWIEITYGLDAGTNVRLPG